MKIPTGIASAAATTGTVLLNFWPWLLASFLLGIGSGAYPSFLITRAVYQRATLRAELNLSNFEKALATERLEQKDREARIMQAAKVNHEKQVESIDGVADELRRLSAGVRVCTSQSTMRLTPAAAGPAQPVAGGESRPADLVLQELAAEFARRADTNAAAFNSLMERWEKLADPPDKREQP